MLTSGQSNASASSAGARRCAFCIDCSPSDSFAGAPGCLGCVSKVRDRLVSWHGALRADAGSKSPAGTGSASCAGLRTQNLQLEYLKGETSVLAFLRGSSGRMGGTGCSRVQQTTQQVRTVPKGSREVMTQIRRHWSDRKPESFVGKGVRRPCGSQGQWLRVEGQRLRSLEVSDSIGFRGPGSRGSPRGMRPAPAERSAAIGSDDDIHMARVLKLQSSCATLQDAAHREVVMRLANYIRCKTIA